MSRPIVSLSRKFHISAAHCLRSSRMTDEENWAVFGKCNRVHGHNYTIKVVLKGEVDETTGMLIDIAILKQIAQEKITDVLDHHNIDEDIPYFFERPSTLENLVVFVWQQVVEGLKFRGIRTNILYEIEINETESNSVTWRGERTNRKFDR